jgi:hypothetical protein
MKLEELKSKLKKDKQHPKCYNSKFLLHLPEGRIIDLRSLVMKF